MSDPRYPVGSRIPAVAVGFMYHGRTLAPRSDMTITTSLPDPVRKGVELRCVAIVAWVGGRPSQVDEAALQTSALKTTIAAGQPGWVQLAPPGLTPTEQSWFEGSVDPWADVDAPEIDWTRVEPTLDALGIGPSALDLREQPLLERLPHLFGRGVARVVREVWGTHSCAPAQLRFFPTVAFRQMGTPERPRFWTVRMTVGVIRNVVVTVRLPDLYWDHAAKRFDYTPGGPLEVAQRSFPQADDLTPDDIAEAIGLQQASTARAVTELVRTQLTEIERASREQLDSGTHANRKRQLANASRVIEMTDHLYQLDRQLERLLRRIELDTFDGTGRSISSEMAVRYRFALDELRSLEGNGRLASDAITQAIAGADQAERERFEFVAAVLGSAILAPTLVASVYGANVALPA